MTQKKGVRVTRISRRFADNKKSEPRSSAFFRVIRVLSHVLGRDWPWIAAVLLAALIAAWPAISQPGLLNTRGGGDSPFLLQRLHQMAAALSDGHFPVRWMPDANYGYGYPFYNFYAPLSIYIAAAFRFLGFSFVRAIHLAQLAGFVVAGLGMFYLGRRWLGSRWAGLLAAVAYTVAPFHMVNVYTRGDSLAEFWAMAFYPLALLAADHLITARGNRAAGEQERKGAEESDNLPLPRSPFPPISLALLALAYAALILSHNISALIFSPFLLLYIVVRLGAGKVRESERLRDSETTRRPISRSLLLPIGALLLALALAAWFFLPALAEQDLAQLGPVTEGYFHYSNHFRGLDLVQGGLIFDYNPDGGVAFRLGLVQAGLALMGAAVLLWSWRSAANRAPSFVILSGLLIAVLMVTPLSRPLWDHLPLLPFTQFPWRFLSVASFFAAAATGALVLVTDRPAARAAIALLGSLVLLAAGLLGLQTDALSLTDADVTAERLAQYEWFTGNIGTTISAEYLTPESLPRPWTSRWLNSGERDRVVATEGELMAELLERRTTSQTWRLVAGEGGAQALFPTLYWPGWRAAIDGQPAELVPYPASGLMALAVPEGEHTITLELGRTPVRRAAEWLSLAALIGVAALFLISERRAARSTPLYLYLISRISYLVLIPLSLLAFAFLWRDDPRELSAGDMTWDFAQMGYLHHDPGGVAFTNNGRLHEYGYSGDTIAAGTTLTVTLSLSPGTATAATLDLLTPASARPTADGTADPPSLATQTIELSGEAAVFTMPISPLTPAGLYVPRLTLHDARPLLPSGGTRGDLFLRPIRVTPTGGPSPAADLDVRPLAMDMRDATTLDGRFDWNVPRPLGSRYQLSWRVQNGDGLTLSQLDAQPGYGFQPTDGWEPDAPIHDWLALRLPDELTGPPPYPLVMILYDVTTGEQLLLRRVGAVVEADGRLTPMPHAPVFASPNADMPVDVTFADEGRPVIDLLGYEQTVADGLLELTLYWRARGNMPADFVRFVHLIDATGAAVAQLDGHPAGNSYPTGQWVEGEVVTDSLRLDLPAVPPGAYQLATGFYRNVEGLPRLDAATPAGPLPDGRAILPETVTVP